MKLIGCYRLKNKEWKRFDIISKASSVIWTRRFYEAGSFQLQLKNNPLKAYDIIVHEKNAGIVMRVEERNGVYTVTGYDLKGITHFRRFNAESIEEINAETKIKEWAQNYLATAEKAVEGLSVAPNKGIETMLPSCEIAEGRFSEILASQSKAAELGWDIVFDKGKLLFEVIKPGENTEAVFSRKSRTLEDAVHITDFYDKVNVTEEEGTSQGIKRREGEEIVKESDYITGTATSIAKEYLLGDFVTIEDFGKKARIQITEIQYVYEPNKIIAVPSFGEVKQNIIKKLLKG